MSKISSLRPMPRRARPNRRRWTRAAREDVAGPAGLGTVTVTPVPCDRCGRQAVWVYTPTDRFTCEPCTPSVECEGCGSLGLAHCCEFQFSESGLWFVEGVLSLDPDPEWPWCEPR